MDQKGVLFPDFSVLFLRVLVKGRFLNCIFCLYLKLGVKNRQVRLDFGLAKGIRASREVNLQCLSHYTEFSLRASVFASHFFTFQFLKLLAEVFLSLSIRIRFLL